MVDAPQVVLTESRFVLPHALYLTAHLSYRLRPVEEQLYLSHDLCARAKKIKDYDFDCQVLNIYVILYELVAVEKTGLRVVAQVGFVCMREIVLCHTMVVLFSHESTTAVLSRIPDFDAI